MKGAKEYAENNNIRCYTVGHSFCNGMHHRAICGVYEGTPGGNHSRNDEQAGCGLLVAEQRLLLSFIIQSLVWEYRSPLNREKSGRGLLVAG
jgi:hypothetical protein